MVDAHTVLHGGRVDRLCYVTTAAVAWLITGIDCAAPFSGVWRHQGTGPADADRAIAFGYDDEFEEDHTFIALPRAGKTVIIDSCLAEGRALTVCVLDEAPTPPPGQVARLCSCK